MAQCRILTHVIAAFMILSLANSANILILLTIPSISNHIMYRPIIDALAARNHSIVIATTDPSPESTSTSQWPNVDEIDLHDVSYPVWRKHLAAYASELATSNDKLLFYRMYTLMSIDITEAQLSSPAMRKIIDAEEEKFDIVMGSIVHLSNLGVAAKYKAPFIGIHHSDLMNTVHYYLGNSFKNAYYPDHYYPLSRSLMTWQGFEDRYYESRLYSMIQNSSVYFDQFIEKKLKIKTKSLQLLENIDMVMLTTDAIWSVARPVRPNTLFIGDTHLHAVGHLDNETQKFLDEASDGAVYFSLGSNIHSSSLSKNQQKIILEALKYVPYRVLLKWEGDKISNVSPNVFTAAWFPQQDVLAHRNMKVFVTQGDHLSMDEAVYHEVPMVVIPLFEDQPSNAINAIELGIGVEVHFETMTSKDLSEAIIKVATNSSFVNNILALSDRMFDRQKSSLNTAVWWVEYLMRHRSGSHFQHPRISTMEYLFMDVIFATLSTLIIVAILLYLFVRALLNKYFRRNQLDMSKRFTFAPQKNK